MIGAWLETAIIMFFIGAMALMFWRGGAANPVGTGSLQTKVNALKTQFETLSGGLKGVTERMGALEANCATGAEIETLRGELRGDRRRTEEVFLKLEAVQAEIADMRSQQSRRDGIIEALSESVRTLSDDLREHRAEIGEKLDHLDAMSERIDAHGRAIEAVLAELPALRKEQAEIAASQAETATDVKHVMKQVDRLYDVLVPKGMER